MKIDVTQEDIDNGCPESYFRCPVALAISKIGEECISVGHVAIFIGGKVFRTPSEVKYFISLFDKNEKVKPFSFELNI